jgi:aminoglycoside 3-N-acetyltransferase I
VYLYDIAVHPDWQRQGLGGQLVAALHSEARRIGAAEVFVQADVEDDHALAFYRALRGREARVRHYTFELTSSL